MKPSQDCMDFIKGWEACSLKPYKDQAGLWTIGWGHLMHSEDDKTERITQAEADSLFETELLSTASRVESSIEPLSQNQFDAICAFAFNVGVPSFLGSTMRRLLMDGDTTGAASQFLRWTKITVDGQKVVSEGLVKRRTAERDIFSFANYDGRP